MQVTLSIKMNNEIGPYFQSCKGVRQGDPLSSFLFNFAANYLSKMIHQAQINGLVVGLVPHLVDKGVVVLQYADDTIILFENNIDSAVNIKILLYAYEAMFGLKINFQKGEILMLEADGNEASAYAEMFLSLALGL